jgi:hypothetical protein
MTVTCAQVEDYLRHRTPNLVSIRNLTLGVGCHDKRKVLQVLNSNKDKFVFTTSGSTCGSGTNRLHLWGMC